MSTPADEVRAITETLRDLGYRQVDAQFQSSDNFDTKSVGVLGFDGAALAALLTAQSLFYSWSWTIPASLVVLSALTALLSIQSQSWEDGPDPRAFYDEIDRKRIASSTAVNVDLISQFGGPEGAIARNDRRLRTKSRRLLAAIWLTVLAGAVSAILIGLSRA